MEINYIHTYKILLIESEKTFIDFTLEAIASFTDFDCKTKVIHNLADSNNELQIKYDLILTALTLPDSDGLATFLTVQKNFPHIPIIALIDFQNDELTVKLSQHGAKACLSKHVDKRLFIQSLKLSITHIFHAATEMRLANFVRFNPFPVIEINAYGKIAYLNPTANAQFPDLLLKGTQHPLLKDVQTKMDDFKKNSPINNLIVFQSDICVGSQYYERQIFSFSEANIYIFIIDISAKKITERALRDHESILSNISENIDEFFFIFDCNKEQFVYVCPGYELLWQKSANELYQNPNSWLLTINEADKKSMQAHWEKIQKAEPTRAVFHLELPNGNTKKLLLRAVPAKSQPNFVIGYCVDVTDIK